MSYPAGRIIMIKKGERRDLENLRALPLPLINLLIYYFSGQISWQVQTCGLLTYQASCRFILLASILLLDHEAEQMRLV
jgi:hypothetical protein